MIRISLIVAIIAGLAVAVINFVQVKEVITTTRNDLNTTSNTLVQTQATLRTTRNELKATEAALDTTTNKLLTAEQARDTALADARTKGQQIKDLTTKLNDTTKQRDDAQAELAAWKALGIPVDQIKTLIANYNKAQKEIAVLNSENQLLTTRNKALNEKIEYLVGKDHHIRLPEALRAKIMAVDPKWGFVVLNVGENEGIIQNGELLVNRNGKLVAKVRVSMVQPNRCIANLIPDWQLGDVIEGDSAIPAYY